MKLFSTDIHSTTAALTPFNGRRFIQYLLLFIHFILLISLATFLSIQKKYCNFYVNNKVHNIKSYITDCIKVATKSYRKIILCPTQKQAKTQPTF